MRIFLVLILSTIFGFEAHAGDFIMMPDTYAFTPVGVAAYAFRLNTKTEQLQHCVATVSWIKGNCTSTNPTFCTDNVSKTKYSFYITERHFRKNIFNYVPADVSQSKSINYTTMINWSVDDDGSVTFCVIPIDYHVFGKRWACFDTPYQANTAGSFPPP